MTTKLAEPIIDINRNARTSIAIIGAGPGGLTLARLLYLSALEVDVTVYEQDTSSTSRPGQGGTLDLHAGSGLLAMQKCDIDASFNRYARYDAQKMVLTDRNGTSLIDMGDDSNNPDFQRPEIDRVKLREILLESVPIEYIKWGYHLKEVTEDQMLIFKSGEVHGPFDLIVGADGAWSKVRNVLHGAKPVYSGVSGYEMKIKDAAKTCPYIDKLVGQGTFVALSDSNWLSAQRLGDHSIEVRRFFFCPEGEAKMTLTKLGKEATLDIILQSYNNWAPEIIDIFLHADVDSMKAWTLYELPVGTAWTHKKGFTLIGDAASLATPFAGQGVNKAMEDALRLSQSIETALLQNSTSLDEAVHCYEQEMFPRAERIQRWTMVNKLNALGPAGPVAYLVGFLRTMMSDSETWWVRWLASAPFMTALSTYLHARLCIGWAIQRFWRGN